MNGCKKPSPVWAAPFLRQGALTGIGVESQAEFKQAPPLTGTWKCEPQLTPSLQSCFLSAYFATATEMKPERGDDSPGPGSPAHLLTETWV